MAQNTSERRFLFDLSLYTLFIVLYSFTFFVPHKTKVDKPVPVEKTTEQQSEDTLGYWGSQKPVIYISGGNYKYSSGGLIPLASTDDPSVEINAYNVKGNAKFELYEADRDGLFNYLLYKNENEQINNSVDTGSFKLLTSFEKEIGGSQTDKVGLPLADRGIYYLKLTIGEIKTNSYIVRSNIGSIVKEAGDEFVFWSQDFRSKKSISSGNVKVYNLKDKTTELSNVSIGNDGIAKTRLSASADIALIEQDKELAVVPINLRYLNTGYEWDRFADFKLNKRYFTFTDRPLYRPGDTVYFKSIIRDEDDVRYTIPTGSVEVTINDYSQDPPIYKRDLQISGNGYVSGELKLPENVKKGGYQVSITGSNWEGYAQFEVQEFRKPEYFVELSTNKKEYVSGDDMKVTVSGQYFSGQPLNGADVSYKVYSTDYYDWEYYDYYGRQISDDYRYGYWRGDNAFQSGTVELDSRGIGEITIDSSKDNNEGKSRVYSVEVNFTGVSSDQAFDRKNILVFPGQFGIYRKNYFWSVKAGDSIAPVFKLRGYEGFNSVGNRNVKVKVEGEVYEVGKRNYYDRKFEKVLEKEYKTNNLGEVEVRFTPEKEGSYKIILEAKDDRENEIIKTFYVYATDKNYASYYNQGSDGKLSITLDRALYEPGDLAKITLYSEIADRDVFLTFDRDRLNRYQIVKMQGNLAKVDLPIVNSDMPNIYLTASSFSNSEFQTISENIKVSAERMRLQVEIKPDSSKYKPGDMASVEVITKDIYGNPISADVALWAVDKAIFQLASSKLGNIFDSFWFERYLNTQLGHSLEGILVNTAEGGGCFAADTKILLGDGSSKNIEDVRVGDTLLTRVDPLTPGTIKAKVTKVAKKSAWGYLIINGKLKITDDHILLVNGEWKEAGRIRLNDILATSDGQEIVNSIEWQLGKTEVYNLEVDRYHTFFADGIYVHNQKGGPAREILKDTAYWNPSVITDTNGRARVNIKLPDNLTTWTVSAVAASNDTKVGQQKVDIVVTKDIIVRPIIPNVLREGDEIVLSALVQNFTDTKKTFNVLLEFAEGEVDEPEKQNVEIESQGTYQAFWNVKPNKVKEGADLRIIAYEVNNKESGDNLVSKIDVKRFGFKEVSGFSGDGDEEFKVNINEDAVNSDTKLKLYLSPTILGSLPASMDYLINYPYGCVEQTTSRFVPTVIVKKNASLFPNIMKEKDIDGIITKGISRLESLQQSNGGWGWWNSPGSAYISAYVVEYLLQAKSLGYEVSDQMLERAKYYFESLNSSDNYDIVSRFYALTLLKSDKASKNLSPVAGTNDFLLSMIVIANKAHGVNDNNANGYNELMARAKKQGNMTYWSNAGDGKYFASTDAATAMAIRAILAAGGDRELAVSAVKYLSSSRSKYYWSNTYSTANVIRAIVDLSQTSDEQNPNYTYKVEVDGKVISSGAVTSARQNISEINIAAKNLKVGGSTIELTKTGEGQMYSTLVFEEFRTDRNYQPSGKPLKITRKIVNDKDLYRSLAVGEVAKITLEIEGLSGNSEYIVVDDTLPSGFVPINEGFRNEQFDQKSNNNYYYWGREYKADGVVFSTPVWGGDSARQLSYRARVVNSGEFWIPPATVEKMYSPEINGVSEVSKISIKSEAHDLPRPLKEVVDVNNLTNQLKKRSTAWYVTVIIIIILAVIALRKKSLILNLWEKVRSRKNLQKIDTNEKQTGESTTSSEEKTTKPL